MSSHAGTTRVLEAARLSIQADSGWARLPVVGLVLGGAGVAASFALGRGESADQLYHSWLVAFMFFLSIALGGLFFVLVHYATKAGWGVAVRRLAENAMGTLGLFAALWLPLLLGLHNLYHWSHEDAVTHDAILQAKQGFLNRGFFTVRAVVYFACWLGIAWLYSRGSKRQDTSGDESITRRLTAGSGPAIIAFGVTVSFAAIDWLMSLEPHWYSTIFGVYYFSGCLVGIFAFMVLVSVALTRSGYLRHIVTTEHFHDLGKLLFAFTVFWSYIAFSQFFLIWYGNIPEETVWYLERMNGSWLNVTIFLGLGHFIIPFFFLMPRSIKRRPGLLASGAGWMLLMHLVDIHWLVMPTLHHEGFRPHLLDLTTLVGVGGLFVGLFFWIAGRSPLVPVGDPRLAESVGFENF